MADAQELEDDIAEPPCKKSVRRSLCKSWLDKFVWLRYNDGAMYCTFCKKANKSNTFTSGCKNYRVTDVQKHSRSKDHCLASEAHAMEHSGSTVTEAFTRMVDECEEAIIATMTNVYWLAVEDIASLKYNSLNKLVKQQGCESIGNLYLGENAKYTSPDVVSEMQSAISQTIKQDIQEELQKTPYFGLMVDEATDIATCKSLIVYAHLLVNGVRKTRFLADVQLTECTAVAIVEAIHMVLKDYNLNMRKCIGFGSDGASRDGG